MANEASANARSGELRRTRVLQRLEEGSRLSLTVRTVLHGRLDNKGRPELSSPSNFRLPGRWTSSVGGRCKCIVASRLTLFASDIDAICLAPNSGHCARGKFLGGTYTRSFFGSGDRV